MKLIMAVEIVVKAPGSGDKSRSDAGFSSPISLTAFVLKITFYNTEFLLRL